MAGLLSLIMRIANALNGRFRTIASGSHATLHRTARILGRGAILNPRRSRGLVRIGANSVVRGELFVFAHGGAIELGDWCFVGENARIWSAESVRIGHRTLISHDVNIHDTNGHPVDRAARHDHFIAIATTGHPEAVAMRSAPVVIGDDVWVGFGATIMKGVTVGDGAIIAARSVVTRDVPPMTLVAGNPAAVVRQLDQ